MLEKKLDEKNTHRKLEELEDIKKRKKILMGLCGVYTGLLITSFAFLSGNEQPNKHEPLKKQRIERLDSNYAVSDSIKYR